MPSPTYTLTIPVNEYGDVPYAVENAGHLEITAPTRREEREGFGATSAEYERLVRKLKKRPGVTNPWALAHWILNRRDAVGKRRSLVKHLKRHVRRRVVAARKAMRQPARLSASEQEWNRYWSTLSAAEKAERKARGGGPFVVRNNKVVIGAAMPATIQSTEQSLKIVFTRQGNILRGVGHLMQGGQAPVVFRAEIDLAPLVRRLREWHAAEHRGVTISGFPGNIVRLARKIGKSKIVKAIGGAVRSVAKSKLVGAAVGVAAVAFPPVGLPAAAAYATANEALDTIEKANAVRKAARKAIAAGEKSKVRALLPQIQKLTKQETQVRARFRSIAQKARTGDAQAKAATKIFNLVNQNRQRMTHPVDRSIPGILVIPGGKVVPGHYSKVGCDGVGCDEIGARFKKLKNVRLISRGTYARNPRALKNVQLISRGKYAKIPKHVARGIRSNSALKDLARRYRLKKADRVVYRCRGVTRGCAGGSHMVGPAFHIPGKKGMFYYCAGRRNRGCAGESPRRTRRDVAFPVRDLRARSTIGADCGCE